MGSGVTPVAPGEMPARPAEPPPALLEGSPGVSLGGGGGGCGIAPRTASTGSLLLGLGALLSLGWRRRRVVCGCSGGRAREPAGSSAEVRAHPTRGPRARVAARAAETRAYARRVARVGR